MTLDRIGLHIHNNLRLEPGQNSAFLALIQRRIEREPTAYITGHKEFYGLDFLVSPATLIPRPETEVLVENAIEIIQSKFHSRCLIADIGTGCGAIAIALSLNLPGTTVYATDISSAALEIAEANCRHHSLNNDVRLLHGNLVEPLPEPVNIIVANLPYIPDSVLSGLSPEITKYEPELALSGGPDGLACIKEFIPHASKKLLNGGGIMLEVGYDQGQAVCELAKKYFPDSRINVIPDLSGLDRVVSILPA